MTDDIKQRLEAKTTKHPISDCWIYQGVQNHSGHCQMKYNDRYYTIHRLSAYIHWGFDLNSSMMILHKPGCFYPNCWNPKHLYEGTNSDNQKDSVLVGTHFGAMKTHCKHGHEFNEDNTGISPSTGKRYCKHCKRDKAKVNYYNE